MGSRSPSDDHGNKEGGTSVEKPSPNRRDACHELTRHSASGRNPDWRLHQLTAEIRGRVAEQRVAIRATEASFLIAQIRLDETTRRVRCRVRLGTRLWRTPFHFSEISSLACSSSRDGRRPHALAIEHRHREGSDSQRHRSHCEDELAARFL